MIQSNRVSRGVVALDGIEIPLNLLYIISSLENPKKALDAYGYEVDPNIEEKILGLKLEVELLDLQFYTKPWGIIREKINNYNPDVIGITGVTVQANSVNLITKFIKKINNNVKIIFGGIHASSLPELTLNEMPAIDFVAIGEGEITLLELCAVLSTIDDIKSPEAEGNFKKIKGLAFRSNSKIHITEPRPLIRDLDKLPYPAREKLENEKYRPIFSNYWTLPTTAIIASRGCPFNCKFCSKTIFKRTYRVRNPEEVVKEMNYCAEKFNITDFRFYDDSLTTDRRWVVELCKILIRQKREKNIKFTWNGWSRVDTVSVPLLRIMKEAGCFHLKFGAESASNRILDEVNKQQTYKDIINAFSISKKVGIETKACMMFNFLNEDKKSINKTLDFIKRINPEYATFTILKPLPGSELYKEADRNGWLIHKNWDFYSQEDPPVMKPQIEKGFDPDLIRKVYNKFYLRPKYIINQIVNLKRFPSIRSFQRLIQGAMAFLPSNKKKHI